MPIKQGERLGNAGDRRVHHVRREQHPLTGGIERQAMIEQTLPHRQAPNLHAGLGQKPLGLVEDLRDEIIAQDVQRGTH